LDALKVWLNILKILLHWQYIRALLISRQFEKVGKASGFFPFWEEPDSLWLPLISPFKFGFWIEAGLWGTVSHVVSVFGLNCLSVNSKHTNKES
jgi:hypothetical protein